MGYIAEPTAAGALFDAHLKFTRLEGDLYEILHKLYGDIDEFTHDYYDDSIEVYGCKPSLAAQQALNAYGFVRVWQHPHKAEETRRDCKCPSALPAEDQP